MLADLSDGNGWFMNLILRIIKKSFLWTYASENSGSGIACSDSGFIFLSPKSWFVDGKQQRWRSIKLTRVTTVLIPRELIGDNAIRVRLKQQVRAIYRNGRPRS